MNLKKMKTNKICCHGTAVSKSYNILLQFLGLGNMGKYSVLGLCIVPPCGRANTATLELNISPYCPPSHAIIYTSRYPVGISMEFCFRWRKKNLLGGKGKGIRGEKEGKKMGKKLKEKKGRNGKEKKKGERENRTAVAHQSRSRVQCLTRHLL